MSAAIMNMALVMGIVQIANKYQLDAPENTLYLRMSYGAVQLISFIIIAFIYSRITSKNDQTKLSYSEPKSPFAVEENPIIETNFRDYDLSQLKQLGTQTVMSIAIILLMHFQWGYMRPLLLQSVLGFRTLFSNPIVRIWVLGTAAEGELERPFKQPNPFGGAPETVTPKDIKKADKKEEKKKIANKKTD